MRATMAKQLAKISRTPTHQKNLHSDEIKQKEPTTNTHTTP